jgi:hypothetical protein
LDILIEEEVQVAMEEVLTLQREPISQQIG